MKNQISRREFIRTSFELGTVVALSPGSLLSRQKERAKRPNIVLIMADDMGFSDLGCYGSEINTPNIDRLASEGMRFTQLYNCARCCPTRASLLTGLYPHRVGMGTMTNPKGVKRPPAYQGHLNETCLTIAEAVREAGYQTLMSGKWHVGAKRPNWPLDRGFQEYYGLISGASSYFNSSFVEPGSGKERVMARNNTPIVERGEGYYMTDAFTDNAVRMLREYAIKRDPFFLYIAYTAPHWPLHALPEDIRKYGETYYRVGWDAVREKRHAQMMEWGLVDPGWRLSDRDPRVPSWMDAGNKQWEDMRMAVYAAQVDRMDQGVGRILDALVEAGVEKNTLVIFLSDNGGCAEILRGNDPDILPGSSDSYMSYGIGWANVSNTPFRRYKKWVHEGGIATPFIARWPGKIATGSVTHQVGHVIDLMPTILEIVNVKYPERMRDKELLPLDGKSLLPVFLGETREEHETLYWEHLNNYAIRQGDWKLVLDNQVEEWELYDLAEDRTETQNLISDYPEIATKMNDLWNAWAKEVRVWPKKLVGKPVK